MSAAHSSGRGAGRPRPGAAIPEGATLWSPEPKARCPHCARPVAVLRGTHCVYCGKALGPMDAKLLEPSGEAALAIAEVMLERSAVAPNGTRRWVMRIVAIGVGAVVAFGLVGMCARMK